MAKISTLPIFELNSFSRWVANATLAYFESPDVQARFEKWKMERDTQERKEENGKRMVDRPRG